MFNFLRNLFTIADELTTADLVADVRATLLDAVHDLTDAIESEGETIEELESEIMELEEALADVADQVTEAHKLRSSIETLINIQKYL